MDELFFCCMLFGFSSRPLVCDLLLSSHSLPCKAVCSCVVPSGLEKQAKILFVLKLFLKKGTFTTIFSDIVSKTHNQPVLSIVFIFTKFNFIIYFLFLFSQSIAFIFTENLASLYAFCCSSIENLVSLCTFCCFYFHIKFSSIIHFLLFLFSRKT